MLCVSATMPAVWYEKVTTASALPDIAFHTTPSISPYRRDLLATTLNHLNEVKEKNPSRMYLYNLFVQNNAMNEFAVELMSFIAEYTQYLYSRYRSKVLYEIIQESVFDACTFASSIIIARYSEIAQLLPAQTSIDAARNVGAYWELVRDMSNYFPGYQPRFKEFLGDPSMFHQTNPAAGYGMIQQPMPNQQAQMNIFTIHGQNYAKMPDGSMVPVMLGQNGVYYAAPPGTQMPAQQMGWQSAPQQMPGPYGYGQPAASGVFTGGPQGFGQAGGFIPPAPGAQDDTFMPASVRIQNQKPAQPIDYSAPILPREMADIAKDLPVIEPCLENWKSSGQQPYRTFYNPENYREEFINGFGLNIVQRLVPIKSQEELERDEMERNQHLLPMVRVEKARQKHYIRNIESINDIPVKTVIEQIDTGEKTHATKRIQNSWFSCVSATEAISAAKIRHLEKQKEEYLEIYHTFNNIVHILPGGLQNKELIDRLGSAAKDNTTVRKLLKYSYEKARILASTQELAEQMIPEIQSQQALYHKVNNFLTKMANELLRYSLSTEVKIDSYIDDYEELEVYLRKDYSDIHADALVALETRINTEFFSFTRVIDASPVIGQYILGEESDTVDYSSFSELATVTSLSLTSHELFGESLAMASNPNGIFVDPQYDRLLGVTVDYILRNQQLLGFSTYRHYIVTSDGETFMMHKARLASMGGIIHRISLT